MPHTGITDLQALNSRKRVVATLYKEAAANVHNVSVYHSTVFAGPGRLNFRRSRVTMKNFTRSRWPLLLKRARLAYAGPSSRIANELAKPPQPQGDSESAECFSA